MHRSTVVRYQHLGAIDQGCQLAEFEPACKIDGRPVRPACLRTYVRFVSTAGDQYRPASQVRKLRGGLREALGGIAPGRGRGTGMHDNERRIERDTALRKLEAQ